MNYISSLHPRSPRLSVFVLACVALVAVALPATGLAQAGGARSHSAGAVLSGNVKDPTSAIISGAHVQLLRLDGTVVTTGVTDGAGQFQLPQPAPGDYQLTVTLDGFAPLSQPLHVDASAAPALSLTMQLASIATNVNVNADQDTPLVDPDNNQDSATVSADDMKNLPVFDGDIVSTLSAFLDTGASGEGGATLVIDGVESKTVGVSPSAIERVSINQDPYSAQYRNPGRGQVEIITKSTADHYHGAFSFTFRDAALNASNHLATIKPPEQRRIYEGYLTGPITPLPNTAFLFSLTRKEEDTSNQVLATTLGSEVLPAQNVAAPSRTTNFTLKVSHPYNDHHSAYLLYRFYDANFENQNVGGLVQAAAGYTQHNFDMDLTYHDDLTLSPNLLNQFNLLFERNLDSTISDTQAPQVVVEGVGTFGGAQADVYNTEHNPNLSDMVSWTATKWRPQQIKFGIQIPNMGRRILEDKTNRQGTFTFSNNAAYLANSPSTFSIQLGQERFETLYAQPSAFFLDQIQLTDRLTVIPGLRYDYQNALPNTKDGLEPHLSLAYAIDKTHGMVLRTGGAVYIRRVGVNIGQQIARYSNAAEQSLDITQNASDCYPAINPMNQAECDSPSQPPTLFEYAPGLQSPIQGYFGVSVERQIAKKATVTIGYEGYRGWHALREIDVNAPLPPFTSQVRPNPEYSQVDDLDSGGYQKSDALNVSYRGRLGNVFAGFLQYTYSHADADTQWSTFSPQNQYDPNDEWSRTDWDERQRLSLFGTFYPDKPVTFGVGFYDNTPMPYTETTGLDSYDPGLFNARPEGVPRNSLNGGDYEDLQLRLGYTHKFHPGEKDDPEALAFSVASFNTLNHPNYSGYDGVVGSADFMQPTAAGSPRRTQLSASYNF